MKTTVVGICGIILTAVSLICAVRTQSPVAAATPKSGEPDKAAVERSRKIVRMLDDVYKQAIVLITDKYVHGEDDFAAGSAAVLWFENISKNGSHQVRLIDATGEPYDEKNVAQDDFEKAGIERLKAGDAFYEQVVPKASGYALRAMTPVPVVMQKCVMCHPHYASVEKNRPIGAISYMIPIE